MSSKSAFRSLWLVICFWLGGCAAQQVQLVQPVNEKTRLSPEKGLVVARVINTTSYPFALNQLTLTPANVFESEEVKFQRLQWKMDRTPGTTAFASQVAPGEYSLRDVRAFHVIGELMYSLEIPADVSLGTFRVGPGKITDLGTLVYYRKSDGESMSSLLLRVPESRPGEVLDVYFPHISYQAGSLLSWLPDDMENDRYTEYATVASSPNMFDKRYLAPDGTLYFLGKLGVLLARSPAGDWYLDAVDTNLDLLGIAANGEGALAVGGIEGQLFYKPPGGDWLDISLDHAKTVRALSFTADGQLDVLATRGTRLTVYRGNPAAESVDWTEMNQFTAKVGWTTLPIEYSIYKHEKVGAKIPRYVTDVSLFEDQGKHYVYLHTYRALKTQLFSPARMEIFGYEPDDWTVYEPDPMPKVERTYSAGVRTLGVKSSLSWGGSNGTMMIFDETSATWTRLGDQAVGCAEGDSCEVGDVVNPGEIQSFEYYGSPWYSSSSSAVAVARFTKRNLLGAPVDSEARIIVSDNAGASWQHTTLEPPHKHCKSVAPELREVLIVYCNGLTGDMYESVDSGKNWVHARQHQDF